MRLAPRAELEYELYYRTSCSTFDLSGHVCSDGLCAVDIEHAQRGLAAGIFAIPGNDSLGGGLHSHPPMVRFDLLVSRSCLRFSGVLREHVSICFGELDCGAP